MVVCVCVSLSPSLFLSLVSQIGEWAGEGWQEVRLSNWVKLIFGIEAPDASGDGPVTYNNPMHEKRERGDLLPATATGFNKRRLGESGAPVCLYCFEFFCLFLIFFSQLAAWRRRAVIHCG